jgi:hypothetical protein
MSARASTWPIRRRPFVFPCPFVIEVGNLYLLRRCLMYLILLMCIHVSIVAVLPPESIASVSITSIVRCRRLANSITAA